MDKELAGIDDFTQLMVNYILLKGMEEAFTQCAVELNNMIRSHKADIAKIPKWQRGRMKRATMRFFSLEQSHIKMASAKMQKTHELKKIFARMQEINSIEAEALSKVNWFEGQPDKL